MAHRRFPVVAMRMTGRRMTSLIVSMLALLLLTPFLVGILCGAPYVPTMPRYLDELIKISEAREGHLLIDLGAGDGRLLRAAAKHGIRGIGYEVNLILW